MPDLIEETCQLQDWKTALQRAAEPVRVSKVNENPELLDSIKEMKAGDRDRGRKMAKRGKPAGRSAEGRDEGGRGGG